ncbi:MAG TPA: EAL domain-containing protein, partial [Sulfurimonas autotrophica]|nr:EAL domain-containing protein [Sulfurimonas autotrophica]
VSFSLLRNDIGEVTGYIGYLQDITQQKETEKLLEEQTKLLKHQAYHDMLTALPNRMLFHDRLEQAIAQAKRNNEKFALLFIDLDQFKNINDSLGHHIGDEVLIEAANRLRSTIREQDTLSRLGGDEFTIILRDIDSVQNTTTVARKIIASIKEPMQIASQTLYISSSIGISIYPDDTTIAENLIKYADAAMYRAKDEGRDNFQFYSSEMTTIAFEKVVMENSLRVAIKEEQFEVYYQPQYDIQNNTIVGMEALVRWIHPSLGIISPVKFIPLAETTGLIVDIDRIVMKTAMQQFVQWYEKGLNPGILALNLAMRQLKEEDFISYLLGTMQELHFKPEWLELEITEGQMMSNPDLSIQKLQRLYQLGIEIAIDDFGTGYSSLSYLKKMPLSKLKIDQSFVHDIPDDEDDVAIIKAIIALGKSLNLSLIAEGVETEEQKEFLVHEKCDYVQGYFYSKPIHHEEMTKLLAAI